MWVMQIKEQGFIISEQEYWHKSQRIKLYSFGMDAEEKGPLFTADENVDWFNILENYIDTS